MDETLLKVGYVIVGAMATVIGILFRQFNQERNERLQEKDNHIQDLTEEIAKLRKQVELRDTEIRNLHKRWEEQLEDSGEMTGDFKQ